MKKKLINGYLSWKEWTKHKNLQTLIVVPFTMIGILGIVILAAALYFRFSNTAQNISEQKNSQIVEQTNQSLNNYLKQMMKVSDAMYYQTLKQKDTESIGVAENMNLLYNANQDKVVSIALFDINGKAVVAAPISNVKKRVLPKTEDWYQNAMEKIEDLHFSTPHVQNIFDVSDASYRWVVSLSRFVEFNRNGNVEEGVLLVDMNFSGIEQVLKNVSLGNNGYLYLMDQDGEIIYHPKQELLYAGIYEEDNMRYIHQEDGTFVNRLHGKKQMITIKTVGYTGWKLVAVVPMEEVMASYSNYQSSILIYAVCLIFFMIQISSYVSKKITDPINQLEKSVEQLEKGNWNTEITISGSEEIRHLGLSIRSMVEQLRRLMNDIVKEQELKRKSELEALQMQINPHFLYNTLDSIVWMIENEKYQGAVTMVTSLARLFRIALSKGKNIISVKDELAHAEYYMAIQNIRYKNKFTYSIEADDEVKKCVTVKLILQPMIENAINHGMAYMDSDDEGHIWVRARIQNNELWMEVEDNGCGMTEEKANDILKANISVKSRGSGVGMRNVNERIKIHFGRQYGIRIISEPDEGTLIRMIMPVIMGKKANQKEDEL